MATRISPADRHTTIGQHAGMERSIAISAPTVGSAQLYSSIVSTAPGDRTRVHHHGACETSIYILSGAASYTLRPDRPGARVRGDGRRLRVHPGRRDPCRGQRVRPRAARRRADPQLPGFARGLRGRRTGWLGRRPRPVLRHWDGRTLPDLLAEHGLTDAPEAAFANDGWSGASLTRLVRPSDGAAFVLKRTSWAVDWIARSTRDHALREGFIAATPLPLPEPLVAPYLGAAADGTAVAMLMPDLSDRLLGWELGEGPADAAGIERILAAVARLHAAPWPIAATPGPRPRLADRAAGRAAAAPRAPVRRATGGRRRRRRQPVPRGLDGLRPAGVVGRRRARAHVSTPTRDRCLPRSASCPRRASTATSSSAMSRRSRMAGSRSSTGR